jgi:flagellar biosynthesis protein FlhB
VAERPGGERTEAPTPKKLTDAVKKGDLLQSKELVTALGVAAGVGWLWLLGPAFHAGLGRLLADGLSIGRADIDGFDPTARVLRLLLPLLWPLAGLAGLTLIAAIAAPAITGALGWRSSQITWKGERLSPLAGFKRMFGVQGLVELLKSLAKTIFLTLIALWWLAAHAATIAGLGAASSAPAAALGALLFSLCLWLLGGFVVIALIDVPVQYAQRMSRLKMTLQEVKDEHKESEGAPEKKAAIRRRQQAILSKSMRAGIRAAQVVVTNPEHFAVALRYQQGEDVAPVIAARGSDELAAAIRNFAAECRVPVLSAPPLARAIYFTGTVGQLIDTRLYAAVATLLAFLFRLDRAVAAQADLPDLPIPPELMFDAEGRAAA